MKAGIIAEARMHSALIIWFVTSVNLQLQTIAIFGTFLEAQPAPSRAPTLFVHHVRNLREGAAYYWDYLHTLSMFNAIDQQFLTC